MKTDETLYLVDGSVLPSVYISVVKAKKMLSSGQAKTIGEAVAKTNISRSAFYKYKDHVHTFSDKSIGQIYTLNATLADAPGVLQAMLAVFANMSFNVLTINQNIPYNDIAPVTISFCAVGMDNSVELLIKKLKKINGLLEANLVGSK